jgi:hypothetical protein
MLFKEVIGILPENHIEHLLLWQNAKVHNATGGTNNYHSIKKLKTLLSPPNDDLVSWAHFDGFHIQLAPLSVKLPIPVAARSKAWVYGRSLTGIVGSNPA